MYKTQYRDNTGTHTFYGDIDETVCYLAGFGNVPDAYEQIANLAGPTDWTNVEVRNRIDGAPTWFTVTAEPNQWCVYTRVSHSDDAGYPCTDTRVYTGDCPETVARRIVAHTRQDGSAMLAYERVIESQHIGGPWAHVQGLDIKRVLCPWPTGTR